MAHKDIYLTSALEQVPRLLGLLDRAKESATYGCFDRPYWHYRTKDFASVIPQYATLSLALLYSIDDGANPWFRDARMKEGCLAGMTYWARQQNRDGSSVEAYPGDHSFGGTAFALYFMAESYDCLKDEMDAGQGAYLVQRMKRAADFLMPAYRATGEGRGDSDISNHNAGSVAALYKIFRLTGEEKYKGGALSILKDLREGQSREGWFPEYGGADLGYSTVLLYFLAHYFRLSGDTRILPCLERLIDFSSHFVHPDGTMGGGYASRNTTMILPAGFEIMAQELPLAKSIAAAHLEAIREKKTLTPACLDDAGLTCFYLIAYLEAYMYARDIQGGLPVLPVRRGGSFLKYFDESGLLVRKTEHYYAVLCTKKGGVLEVYDIKKRSLILSDRGWVAASRGGTLASGVFNPDAKTRLSAESVTVSTNFAYLKAAACLTPAKSLASRTLFALVAPWGRARHWVKGRLRRELTSVSRWSRFLLRRTVSFGEQGVEICDDLKGFTDRERDGLSLSADFSPVYYFTKGLTVGKDTLRASPARSRQATPSGDLQVVRRLDI